VQTPFEYVNIAQAI